MFYDGPRNPNALSSISLRVRGPQSKMWHWTTGVGARSSSHQGGPLKRTAPVLDLLRKMCNLGSERGGWRLVFRRVKSRRYMELSACAIWWAKKINLKIGCFQDTEGLLQTVKAFFWGEGIILNSLDYTVMKRYDRGICRCNNIRNWNKIEGYRRVQKSGSVAERNMMLRRGVWLRNWTFRGRKWPVRGRKQGVRWFGCALEDA